MMDKPTWRRYGPLVFSGVLLLLVLVGLANLQWGSDRINKTLFDAGVVLVFLAVPPATLFPIFYARWFPWWASTLGRALFTKAVGMCLLIDISVLYFIFGDNYFLREYVRLVVFTLIVAGQWWQLYAIWLIRKGSGSNVHLKQQAEDASHRREDVL